MKSIYDKIWESALKAIQTRMMSRADLTRKLSQKYPEEEGYIIQIMDEMGRVELINDRRYAEQLISHLTQRPIGRLKIMVEFKKRGLDDDLIEPLLMAANYNEEAMCRKALEEKEKTVHETDPRKRKQKLMNFLRNRGFKDAVIYSTLNRIP
ncbi:regulatory protein RecX [Candidatus Peregrinibacteria bacterium]|nr:regulatory protein RecX [Candidatus Peregrinibacteria bacterium]